MLQKLFVITILTFLVFASCNKDNSTQDNVNNIDDSKQKTDDEKKQSLVLSITDTNWKSDASPTKELNFKKNRNFILKIERSIEINSNDENNKIYFNNLVLRGTYDFDENTKKGKLNFEKINRNNLEADEAVLNGSQKIKITDFINRDYSNFSTKIEDELKAIFVDFHIDGEKLYIKGKYDSILTNIK